MKKIVWKNLPLEKYFNDPNYRELPCGKILIEYRPRLSKDVPQEYIIRDYTQYLDDVDIHFYSNIREVTAHIRTYYPVAFTNLYDLLWGLE